MPVLLFEIGFAGPTTEHIGNALLWHIVSKSPKPMAFWPLAVKGDGDEASLLRVGVWGVLVDGKGGVILGSA